jgi:hypothetical protein
MDSDADPGGPKTYGSHGSGCATLPGSSSYLLPPYMSMAGRALGLPSLLRTMAGLWPYFRRCSFREWQYFVAYLHTAFWFVFMAQDTDV